MLPGFQFASQSLGQHLLTQRDSFISRLSPFDRAARLHSTRPISETEFLQHVSASVKSWQHSEQALISQALHEISAALAALTLPWPELIQLIRTSGAEEGGAPYTRGTAIMLPDAVFSEQRRHTLAGLMLHELFHVLTRHHPQLKQKLYGAIGFYPCAEAQLPASLAAKRITNPDAPVSDYQICLQIEHQQTWALPLLLSDSPDYDQTRGGEFFDYLSLRFYFQREDKAYLAELEEVSGFYEQVGRNTGYILHPEEILADNFALLLQSNWDVPSPEVLKAMALILKP